MNEPNLLETLKQALDLLHKFRNEPETVQIYSRDVDPVIHNLRVWYYTIKDGFDGK